jgi:ACR3 family arsenite efflux pump ArsB
VEFVEGYFKEPSIVWTVLVVGFIVAPILVAALAYFVSLAEEEERSKRTGTPES